MKTARIPALPLPMLHLRWVEVDPPPDIDPRMTELRVIDVDAGDTVALIRWIIDEDPADYSRKTNETGYHFMQRKLTAALGTLPDVAWQRLLWEGEAWVPVAVPRVSPLGWAGDPS